MMDTIHNIARGVCIQQGNILLAYFNKGKYYFLPGGHIEHGESIIETLRREFMEETSMAVEPTQFIGVFEHVWMNKNKPQHEINFIFSIKTAAMTAVQSQEDHLEFRWVPIREMRNINFLPKEMIQIIEDVVMNRKPTCFSTTLEVKKQLK